MGMLNVKVAVEGCPLSVAMFLKELGRPDPTTSTGITGPFFSELLKNGGGFGGTKEKAVVHSPENVIPAHEAMENLSNAILGNDPEQTEHVAEETQPKKRGRPAKVKTEEPKYEDLEQGNLLDHIEDHVNTKDENSEELITIPSESENIENAFDGIPEKSEPNPEPKAEKEESKVEVSDSGVTLEMVRQAIKGYGVRLNQSKMDAPTAKIYCVALLHEFGNEAESTDKLEPAYYEAVFNAANNDVIPQLLAKV